MNVLSDFLAKCGGKKGFKQFILETRPDDTVINAIIEEQKKDLLLAVVKIHILTEKQVSAVLSQAKVDTTTLWILRHYKLTSEQQKILVDRMDGIMIETYLHPNGLFDKSRRFVPEVEMAYIKKMIEKFKPECTESFRNYIDIFNRSLITLDVLDFMILHHKSPAVAWIMLHIKLKFDWETHFIEKANVKLIKIYLTTNQFQTLDGQIKLVERDIQLASLHKKRYKLFPAAQKVYDEKIRCDN